MNQQNMSRFMLHYAFNMYEPSYKQMGDKWTPDDYICLYFIRKSTVSKRFQDIALIIYRFSFTILTLCFLDGIYKAFSFLGYKRSQLCCPRIYSKFISECTIQQFATL